MHRHEHPHTRARRQWNAPVESSGRRSRARAYRWIFQRWHSEEDDSSRGVSIIRRELACVRSAGMNVCLGHWGIGGGAQGAFRPPLALYLSIYIHSVLSCSIHPSIPRVYVHIYMYMYNVSALFYISISIRIYIPVDGMDFAAHSLSHPTHIHTRDTHIRESIYPSVSQSLARSLCCSSFSLSLEKEREITHTHIECV